MSVIRIAFLGTPEFAHHHLESLIQDEHFKVVGVVTQPDRPAGRKMKLQPSPVKVLAEEHNIPVLTPKNVNAPEVLEEMAQWKAEAAAVVAFGQIMSDEFLELFDHKVVNVHASLLPRWRGAAPIQRAIMAGDKVSGVSLQVMVKKLDAGDVLGEKRIEISENMNAIELHDVLKQLGAQLLHVEFMDFIRGNLSGVPQDEDLVTLAPKIQKTEGAIDWHKSAQDIHNQIRGLAMGPGAYTTRNDKKLKIVRTEVLAQAHGEPGEVIEVTNDSFHVACGKGALLVNEVQPESKSKQPVSAYLKGYPFSQGEKLK